MSSAKSGDPDICRYIRECLDSGADFSPEILLNGTPPESAPAVPKEQTLNQETFLGIDEVKDMAEQEDAVSQRKVLVGKGISVGVKSMMETLVSFLESLGQPLVPLNLQNVCVTEGYSSVDAARQCLDQFPELNRQIFVYMCSFLKECAGNPEFNITPIVSLDNVAMAFAPILLKGSLPVPANGGTRPAGLKEIESWERKKRLFILRILDSI